MPIVQGIAVASFVAVHIFAGQLRFLDGVPRSRWLSLAGGISVAYVFLHVFPELAAAQASLAAGGNAVAWIEHHAYLVALAGIASFYGLERMIKSPRARADGAEGHGTRVAPGVFRIHLASFALYNGLIGYLLVHREEQDLRGLLFYSVAMALHFVVNDFGLRCDHRATYRRKGRWMLAAAIVLGWLAGLATEMPEAAVAVLFAFLAGGVILNVMKEELPEERESRFLPFLTGAAGYAALLTLA